MVNKCVFNCLLKDSMVEVVLLLGRLFQAAGPVTLKARSPKFVFCNVMLSNPCKGDADLNAARFSPTTTEVYSSVRYSGGMSWSALKALDRLEIRMLDSTSDSPKSSDRFNNSETKIRSHETCLASRFHGFECCIQGGGCLTIYTSINLLLYLRNPASD